MSVRACLSVVLAGLLACRAAADESRRLFDFAPVSPSNPVVAAIDGRVEIPVSELRGFLQAEHPKALAEATPAGRRALLDALIDEYLGVDAAYASGVDRTPAFVRRMEATRTMLLTDFMSVRAAQALPAGPAPADPAAALAERLFEAASIEVSNEAYAVLKQHAATIDAIAAAATRGPVVETPQRLSEKLQAAVRAAPDVTLVRWADKTISVRQLLVVYAGLPAPRPAIATEPGLTEMIKAQFLPEMMAREAVRRGIEADPEFQHKLVQNRNVLLRFHAQGTIEREANTRLQAPDLERQLEAWYQAHRSEYVVPTADGRSRTPPLAEIRSRVLGDYSVGMMEQLKAEAAAALRKAHRIAVDEAALQRL